MHMLSIGARIVMGLVFVVAGLAKVWEPLLSYWQAMPYAQLLKLEPEHWPLAARTSLLVGPLECGLGLALLFNWRPRLAFPLATVLMTFFTGLTAWAWHLGITANCGCFGSLVDRSPGEAAVEDVVFLALLVFAWWRSGSVSRPAWAQSRWVVAGGAVLALVVGGVRFFPEIDRLEGSDLQVGVQLSGLELKGADIDLMKGEYLIELFSPGCGRCMKAVPKLNEWTGIADLPPIVALHNSGQDSEVLAKFRKQLQPRYHIANISLIDFRRLTWRHGYPRLAYLRDGVVQAVWEHFELPTEEQVKNTMNWQAGGTPQ